MKMVKKSTALRSDLAQRAVVLRVLLGRIPKRLGLPRVMAPPLRGIIVVFVTREERKIYTRESSIQLPAQTLNEIL